jgi:DNA excision repair protein ERCC-4
MDLQLMGAGGGGSFHDAVHESLGQRKADVIELYQPMTGAMTEIQAAVVECMEATLGELRRSNTQVSGNERGPPQGEEKGLMSGGRSWPKQLELDEFTIDNALFKNFDRIVRGQLDPVWHRVGAKTRKLVADLTQLRKLLT